MRASSFIWMSGLAFAAWAGMPQARGDDFYVDAVYGDDLNAGTSAGEAWRTITHALATIPDPTGNKKHRVHVAPGTYDPGLGEVFPLPLRNRFEVIGDQGSAVTILDGGGFGAELVSVDAATALLEGLSLRAAANGVSAVSLNGGVGLTLRDLSITSMSGAGVYARAPYAGISVNAERVRSAGNGNGLVAVAGNVQSIDCTFVDSELSENQGSGAHALDNTDLALRRCRITGNAATGISASASLFAFGNIDLEDTLVADNGAHGIWATGDLDPAIIRVSLDRCTVAGNGLVKGPGGSGLAVWYEAYLYLNSCNVYGNQDDIYDPDWVASIEYTNVGDGDFAGTSGNFSLDPLYVDPDGGDYRLSWGSPCIESGDPAWPAGQLDLASTARPVDGDLDALERFDVGAFEFAPLFLRSNGAPGTNLELELWGEAGAQAAVYWMRGPLVAAAPTPFGELDLDRNKMLLLFKRPAAPGPPTIWSRPIPGSSGLSGKTFSFQALVDSSTAPAGRAFTNPIEWTAP